VGFFLKIRLLSFLRPSRNSSHPHTGVHAQPRTSAAAPAKGCAGGWWQRVTPWWPFQGTGIAQTLAPAWGQVGTGRPGQPLPGTAPARRGTWPGVARGRSRAGLRWRFPEPPDLSPAPVPPPRTAIPPLVLAWSPGSWRRELAFVARGSFCFFPSIWKWLLSPES